MYDIVCMWAADLGLSASHSSSSSSTLDGADGVVYEMKARHYNEQKVNAAHMYSLSTHIHSHAHTRKLIWRRCATMHAGSRVSSVAAIMRACVTNACTYACVYVWCMLCWCVQVLERQIHSYAQHTAAAARSTQHQRRARHINDIAHTRTSHTINVVVVDSA